MDDLTDAVPHAPAPAMSPFEIWERLPEPRPSIVDVIETLRAWHDVDAELELTFLENYPCGERVARYRFNVR